MNKKIIFIFLITLFLTGCTVNVNLELDKTSINEETTIELISSSEDARLLKKSFRNYMPIYYEDVEDEMEDKEIDGLKFYNKTEEETENGYKITYTNMFNYSNYKDSTIIKGAFRKYSIDKDSDDEKIIIQTSEEGIKYFNEYDNLDKVTINIKTKLKVYQSNADKVDKKKGIYTWEFTKDDYKKSIYLEASSKEYDDSNLFLSLLIFFAAFVSVIIIVYLLLRNKE